MKPGLPAWALTEATPKDRLAAQRAHSQNTLAITWGDEKSTRGWAKSQGWPAPRLNFEQAFIKKMFESDEAFELALSGSGIVVSIPQATYTLSEAELSSLDARVCGEIISLAGRGSAGNPSRGRSGGCRAGGRSNPNQFRLLLQLGARAVSPPRRRHEHRLDRRRQPRLVWVSDGLIWGRS